MSNFANYKFGIHNNYKIYNIKFTIKTEFSPNQTSEPIESKVKIEFLNPEEDSLAIWEIIESKHNNTLTKKITYTQPLNPSVKQYIDRIFNSELQSQLENNIKETVTRINDTEFIMKESGEYSLQSTLSPEISDFLY